MRLTSRKLKHGQSTTFLFDPIYPVFTAVRCNQIICHKVLTGFVTNPLKQSKAFSLVQATPNREKNRSDSSSSKQRAGPRFTGNKNHLKATKPTAGFYRINPNTKVEIQDCPPWRGFSHGLPPIATSVALAASNFGEVGIGQFNTASNRGLCFASPPQASESFSTVCLPINPTMAPATNTWLCNVAGCR